MNAIFQTARQLIGDIFHLPVQPLDSEAKIQEFSQAYTLYAKQNFLNMDSLPGFLNSMEAGRIYYITDWFQVQYILVRIENVPVVFGPFCSLIWTRQDCVTYLNRMGISEIRPMALLAYRSRFAVINEREALHIVQSCIRLFDPSSETWSIMEIDYGNQAPPVKQRVDHAPLRMNYSELIQERYQIEQRFISDIENGNAHAAIMNLRKLQQDVDFLKKWEPRWKMSESALPLSAQCFA